MFLFRTNATWIYCSARSCEVYPVPCCVGVVGRHTQQHVPCHNPAGQCPRARCHRAGRTGPPSRLSQLLAAPGERGLRPMCPKTQPQATEALGLYDSPSRTLVVGLSSTSIKKKKTRKGKGIKPRGQGILPAGGGAVCAFCPQVLPAAASWAPVSLVADPGRPGPRRRGPGRPSVLSPLSILSGAGCPHRPAAPAEVLSAQGLPAVHLPTPVWTIVPVMPRGLDDPWTTQASDLW